MTPAAETSPEKPARKFVVRGRRYKQRPCRICDRSFVPRTHNSSVCPSVRCRREAQRQEGIARRRRLAAEREARRSAERAAQQVQEVPRPVTLPPTFAPLVVAPPPPRRRQYLVETSTGRICRPEEMRPDEHIARFFRGYL